MIAAAAAAAAVVVVVVVVVVAASCNVYPYLHTWLPFPVLYNTYRPTPTVHTPVNNHDGCVGSGYVSGRVEHDVRDDGTRTRLDTGESSRSSVNKRGRR